MSLERDEMFTAADGEGARLNGGAMVHEDRLVHLCVFRSGSNGDGGSGVAAELFADCQRVEQKVAGPNLYTAISNPDEYACDVLLAPGRSCSWPPRTCSPVPSSRLNPGPVPRT